MNTQTFSTPLSLDNDSVIIPDIWDHHEKHSSRHPLFRYASGEAGVSVIDITWGEGIRAMHAAGRIILNALFKDEDTVFNLGTLKERPVIAILAVSDTITAWASITGLIRAGLPVLLLSPRNSPPALAHLLTSTKCRMLVHSSDKYVEEILAETLKLLRESGEAPISLCQLPGYSETYGQDHVQPLPHLSNVHSDDVAVILHTSGSTSFPKPRMISHRTFLQVSKYYHAQGIDMSDQVLGQFALPFFHIFGGITAIGFPTVSGAVMGVFAPTVPPTIPTPKRVLDASVACKAHVLFVVPSFCESWSSDEQAIKHLSNINTVIYAGGPLNRRVGDYLVEKGVNLYPMYGSTELGAVSTHSIDIPSNDWEYFKIMKYFDVELVREDGPEDVYELVVTETPSLRPCTFNTKVGDKPAYATGDLIARHPTNPELWRVAGRKDDQM